MQILHGGFRRSRARLSPTQSDRARERAGNMDIRWLQDFLTVAETGNFTRAAERRNASQAAFSRRIQSLEA
ncbi:MAG: LysR family transcriptional regulator, partial [Bosea sp. (in: a-proteobacteria)]